MVFLRSRCKYVAVLYLLFVAVCAGADDHLPLDLRSIPISDWLNAGDHEDVRWDFHVREAILRVDQRLEVSYTVRIAAKDLNRTGKEHELFLVSRVSSPDGEWLHEPSILRHTLEGELPKNAQAEFLVRVVMQPGEYLLWVTLYDRKTGKHNVAKHRVRVPELRGDPLPDLYRQTPLVEFPLDSEENDSNAIKFVNSRLYLPVHNRRPLHVELISMLSPPEQWAGRARVLRTHNDTTVGALSALSQLNLSGGSLSITGLDLMRRQIIFEQQTDTGLKWQSFLEAMKKAQSLDISTDALQGSKNNGAFFRDVLSQRIVSGPEDSDGMRVIIVVTSAQLFESGSDLRPLQIEGDCNCRVYYLRFRLNVNDVFDQLEKLMKPLRPRTFNLMSALDLRKAIAEIVEDLGRL
jgi:hypothetical protein